MSQPESSSLTPNARQNEKNAKSVSSESSSSDGGVRERVLKEVGLTSTTFIGPAFPPQTNAVKSDIEGSLSEFYKELKEIESPDVAETGRHDAGCVKPRLEKPRSTDTQDGLEEKDVDTRSFTETDGYRKHSERKHTWSHWYENEPYHSRRPRPELNSARDVSEQKQWNYAQPVKRPPDFRFPRPPFPHRAPSAAYLNPPAHVDPSSHRPGLTNHSRDKLFSPGFPPPDVSSHPSWDFYGDSYGHRDEQRRGSDSQPGVGWCSQRNEDEDSDHIQRFDSLDDVWERRHHPPSRHHAHSDRSALVLILMRGLPGSGKSTRARELLSTGPSGIVLSTDDYFAHGEGYRYEPSLLGAAHEWNQRRAKDALFDGRSPVIIDNTNLQAWEMKPYVQMALERGYKVHFCEPETSWKFDSYELERRNKHGVPQEKILQMLERFSSPVSVEIVLNSDEPSHVHQRQRADPAHRPPMRRDKH